MEDLNIKAGDWVRIKSDIHPDEIVQVKVYEYVYDYIPMGAKPHRFFLEGWGYGLSLGCEGFEHAEDPRDLIKDGERVMVFGNGFYVGKPYGKEEFAEYLKERKARDVITG